VRELLIQLSSKFFNVQSGRQVPSYLVRRAGYDTYLSRCQLIFLKISMENVNA
jgi:hypothetical protein